MERYKIIYHHQVVRVDIPRLGSVALRIKEVIYKKLVSHPELYGERLRGTLKGYWKLRVEDWRVVYEIYDNKQELEIFGINHRSDDYKTITKRLGA